MDIRCKRLLFRARHMGTNENDIFFGSFAEENLTSLSKDQLDLFEELMEVNDPELFLWVTGAKPVPAAHDHDVMRMLRHFTLAQARRETPEK
ncbi:succinate dehydrogenase assembly factor 2 [Telmatospirillum siberiense]|uniref:FAD assembly factor SdhE n=1 Tax=Telmatospirillum siberiense TaxID=382514 RepID=A0A2N3PS72_9PROT|nr:succinate dehydrogenase assembly factor 2 [Telmatospirillum siberiense]PKU23248.1 succinate dehydrogenase assembly factor 2 [Telmatospirillum siberiense]